jgi:hypothetical protein
MWVLLDPRVTPEVVGFLPLILQRNDERKVAQQIELRYAHGGGFDPMKGYKIADRQRMTLKYPGDPVQSPLAKMDFPLSRETVYLYDCGIVLILQADGSFEVTRMD